MQSLHDLQSEDAQSFPPRHNCISSQDANILCSLQYEVSVQTTLAACIIVILRNGMT
jgi:hypothetical protein